MGESERERRWEGPRWWRSTSSGELRACAYEIGQLVRRGEADEALVDVYGQMCDELARRARCWLSVAS